mmetsp:Transcript_8754/g.11386  ORF Transcript_8754/g.11386 Transcript_8754/m.11386 type:complete len:1101 (+) Transcript_8754:86-3388(+)
MASSSDSGAINPEVLLEALSHTYNPNKETRQAAEAYIVNARQKPGYLVSLLQLVVKPGVALEVQQASAIQLKNGISRNWKIPESLKNSKRRISGNIDSASVFEINDNDRVVVRNNLLQAMSLANERRVRKLLAECVMHICREDYPDKWPNLLDQILAGLKSGEVNSMYAALLALHKVVYLYMSKPRNERDHLEVIVSNTFPILRELFQNVLSSHNSIEAGEMVNLAGKIYFRAIQYHLPEFVKKPEETNGWIPLFVELLRKPLPEAHTGLEPKGQPTDIQEREKWPWWKAKKQAARILERLFQRYGMVPYVVDADIEFANAFSKGQDCIAVKVLPTILHTLEAEKRGEFCTNVVTRLCTLWVLSATELSVTFKVLKPNLSFLIQDVILPKLCWSKHELQIWDEDPVQLVRDRFSFGFLMNIGNDPQSGAARLLDQLCTYRTRYSLDLALTEINKRFEAYEQHKGNLEFALAKTGGLRAIEELSKILKHHPVLSGQLEPLLCSKVIPELQSPLPALRLSACRCISRFFKIQWKNPENERVVAQGLLQLLGDPDLPVRVQAGCSLAGLFRNGTNRMLEVVGQVLRKVVEGYLTLMKEIAVDDVFEALQVLIARFSNRMGPMAVELLQNLTLAFLRYYKEEADEEDEYAETSMAAADCIAAINQLLMSFSEGEHPEEMIKKVTPSVLPMIAAVFTGGEGGSSIDTMDYIQYALETMRIITYNGKCVPLQFWNYVPLMYSIYLDWAQDYVVEFSGTLENLIQYDPNSLLTYSSSENEKIGKSNLEMILHMSELALENDELEESEKTFTAVMLHILVQSCIGKIDNLIPSLVTLALKHLQKAEKDHYRVNLVALVESCIYYDPILAIRAIGENSLKPFFEVWFETLDYHYALAEQKVAFCALCRFLRFSPSELPPFLNEIRPQILSKIVVLLKSIDEIKKAVENLRKEKKERNEKARMKEFGNINEYDDSDSDDDDLYGRNLPKDVPEERDVVTQQEGSNEASTGYTSALTAITNDGEVKPYGGLNEFSFDGSDAENSDGSEMDDDVDTPLDFIDEFAFLYKNVSEAKPEAQQAFQEAATPLPAETRQALEFAFNQGQARAKNLA